MSFGKRRNFVSGKPAQFTLPSAAAPSTTRPPEPVTAPPLAAPPRAEERLTHLRDTMLRLLAQTALIADAIRDDASIDLPGLDTDLHADTTPLDLRDLEEHFTVADPAQTLHPVYGYAVPAAPARVDSSAQVHLHQLVGNMMELNLFCQRAERSGALRVALQTPKLPALVDRILIGAAFFAGYFENLAATGGGLTAGAPAFPASFEPLQATMERRRLMALDRMLDPQSFARHLPLASWPFVGVETLTRAHGGERFANKVYFPHGLVPPAVQPILRAAPPGLA